MTQNSTLDLTKLTAAQKKKVDFTLPADKHVVFNGEKVTLPAINGMYTFNNEVEINGETVEKKDVLAVFTSRGESEIVVDYTRLKNIVLEKEC